MTAALTVVGYDGSGPSRTALRWALDDARRTGAALELVHASARRALNTAAPQARCAAQLSGSATAGERSRSSRTSTAPSCSRNRHGWLLCSDGARTAAAAARWNAAAS
jgi:nucleotide-binding universal stress UspA family protein